MKHSSSKTFDHLNKFCSFFLFFFVSNSLLWWHVKFFFSFIIIKILILLVYELFNVQSYFLYMYRSLMHTHVKLDLNYEFIRPFATSNDYLLTATMNISNVLSVRWWLSSVSFESRSRCNVGISLFICSFYFFCYFFIHLRIQRLFFLLHMDKVHFLPLETKYPMDFSNKGYFPIS